MVISGKYSGWMKSLLLRAMNNSTKIFVTVKTNAREVQVVEHDATHFTVSVQALPVEGRANTAVRKALARYLGRAPSSLVLRSGATSKHKVFLV